MALIQNFDLISQIWEQLPQTEKYREEELILQPFAKDSALRFCWSSNALEGNTVTLEETISVIEYDEVCSGHTFREYQEAKNLYQSIKKLLLPIQVRELSEDWLKCANGMIMDEEGSYREKKYTLELWQKRFIIRRIRNGFLNFWLVMSVRRIGKPDMYTEKTSTGC